LGFNACYGAVGLSVAEAGDFRNPPEQVKNRLIEAQIEAAANPVVREIIDPWNPITVQQ
jgi:hypothetical protein